MGRSLLFSILPRALVLAGITRQRTHCNRQYYGYRMKMSWTWFYTEYLHRRHVDRGDH